MLPGAAAVDAAAAAVYAAAVAAAGVLLLALLPRPPALPPAAACVTTCSDHHHNTARHSQIARRAVPALPACLSVKNWCKLLASRWQCWRPSSMLHTFCPWPLQVDSASKLKVGDLVTLEYGGGNGELARAM